MTEQFNARNYQVLAMRTECNQEHSLSKINDNPVSATRLLHACIGLSGDSGELSSACEKWLYYGQPLDIDNIIEEMGDCLWYLAQIAETLGVNLVDVMEANIKKLQKRYPAKFDSGMAIEENRDRAAESMAIRKAMLGADEVCNESGFHEPPELPETPIPGVWTINGPPFVSIEHYRAYCRQSGKGVDENYDRICKGCKCNPVHKNNVSGYCPDCRYQ